MLQHVSLHCVQDTVQTPLQYRWFQIIRIVEVRQAIMKQQGWMDEAVNAIVETHLILHIVQYYLAHVPVCEWDKCSSWRNTGYGNTLTAEILLRSGRQGNQWTFTVHGLHLSPHRSHLDYYTPSRPLKNRLAYSFTIFMYFHIPDHTPHLTVT